MLKINCKYLGTLEKKYIPRSGDLQGIEQTMQLIACDVGDFKTAKFALPRNFDVKLLPPANTSIVLECDVDLDKYQSCIGLRILSVAAAK